MPFLRRHCSPARRLLIGLVAGGLIAVPALELTSPTPASAGAPPPASPGAQASGSATAAASPTGGPYWPNWDIARGVATLADGSGGYVLDGLGGLHGFGLGNRRPPAAGGAPYWPNWDIARGVATLADGSGGYEVDGWGGLHPFSVGVGVRPPPAVGAYYPEWDIARGVALLPGGAGGYVLDAWGGLHSFATQGRALPPATNGGPWWPGHDVARGVALLADGSGGYVLDKWGGVHPFGVGGNTPAAPALQARYWPGFPIARGVTLTGATSGLVVDGLGGLHSLSVCQSPGPCPDDAQPTFPIRAAFYYPWFPENWSYAGVTPYTRYQPSLGFYDSANSTLLGRHIAAMRYGGIQAGIASWWGPGTRTDGRLPAMLAAAHGTGLKWAVYYEPEGYGNPSVDQLRSDLGYLRDHYASDPSYLRVDGSFVVFVYADPTDRCDMADRWQQARIPGSYIVLKVFPGWRACAAEAPAWHQYSPDDRVNEFQPFSTTISPGFFHVLEPKPRLDRDLGSWQSAVRYMTASGDPFQLVTTFNEWGEGTSVESATLWASASGFGSYLDVLHDNP
ncbi:MAG: glycoside hydrolase family 71/99 protein [Acidimicrobiales bacterium]